MTTENVPTLEIGDLKIDPPIIQGGMGVRVSAASLAGAVAKTGCAGIIAGVGLGPFEGLKRSVFVKLNEEALKDHIKRAKAASNGGVVGVNLMVALTDYESLVKAAVEAKADMIISGAGLPLSLPEYAKGSDTKLVPIISSARTFKLIAKRWKKRYDKIPDAVVIEGVKAGGHLGYTYDDVYNDTAEPLDQTVTEVLALANEYSPPIPVIVAGGIFDGADIAHFLKLGASGVQMATRFVCTDECDVDIKFKQAYIDAGPDDIAIIKSPVGLPGRVINNEFVKRIKAGETMPFKCAYHCLITCKPDQAPYCIAKVLSNAADGKLDESFAFAGANAHRCTEIVPVKTLVDQLTEELKLALNEQKSPAIK